MERIKYLFVFLIIFSCDIQKKAIKNKQDRTVSELQERSFTRKGDTLTYTVPNIKFKDTTIYTVNRQGTTLRTVYDRSGDLSQIDCISSLIQVTERLEKTLEEQIKQKDKEKEENFDSSVILYLVIGVVVLLLGAFFILINTASKNTKILNLLLNKIN